MENEPTDTYVSEFGVEIERRKAHLESLPGSKLKSDLEAMNYCSYTLGTNGQELSSHMNVVLQSSASLQATPENYKMELVRLLHNYLMAVTTLIDAQRVVMRHRWPGQGKDSRSDFEKNEYSEQRAKVFDSGESTFVVKLRNYTTHYTIPIPNLRTTVSWTQGGPVVEVSQLRLDRDLLLRFDGWTAPALEFLQSQESEFEFGPIIERYQKSVRSFYQWFFDSINERSATIIDEMLSKAKELFLWYSEEDLRPDWLTSGGEPPSDWNGRRFHAEKRRERYAHGTRGYRPITASVAGTLEVHPDAQEWPAFPK